MPSPMRLLMAALMLSGVASARAQTLTADPVLLVFPGQQVNTPSAPTIITMRNTGNQAVSVDSQTYFTKDFTWVGGTCGAGLYTVQAQSSCTYEVIFHPRAERAYSDSQSLFRNGVLVGQMRVAGNGVVGEMNVAPSGAVTFPPTPVGSTSAERTIELVSIRSGPVEVSGITPAASPFVRVGGSCGTPPFMLNPGARCSLTYAYRPVEIGTGQQQTLNMQVPPSYGPSRFVFLRGDATQGSQAITFPVQPARIYAPGFGFPINPPATASSGLAVVYATTTPAVCLVAGTSVAVQAAGTCTLTANQPGNASWSAAPQQSRSITIARANQTLVFPLQATGSRTFVAGGMFAIAPLATSVTPNAGQPIVYSSLDTSVCTVSGSTVTMIAFGTCTLAANQAGNANYNAATQVTSQVRLALFAHGFETLQ